MSVICFASLKGGVGKSTMSINVAHAYAKRGCRTIIIDLDPSGHSSRFFLRRNLAAKARSKPSKRDAITPPEFPPWNFEKSPLARIFLGKSGGEDPTDALTAAIATNPDSGDTDVYSSPADVAVQVRQDLEIIPAGDELRHFLWGKGHQIFARKFPAFVEELKLEYDHIVIDTPPDYNSLMRNAIATADMVIVPVDASEMSIHSLEELITTAQHISKPAWSIVRTMVNKKAGRSQGLSNARLQAKLDLHRSGGGEADDEEIGFDIEDPNDFMRMLKIWERENCEEKSPSRRDYRPIFLLRALVYRVERQNQLTFSGKTSFDAKSTSALAEQYLAVARELEMVISSQEDEEEEATLPFLGGGETENDPPPQSSSKANFEGKSNFESRNYDDDDEFDEDGFASTYRQTATQSP